MMLRKIGIFALSSLTIYFGIAAGLILSDRPQSALATAGEPLAFDALTSVNYAEMPELQPYTARDGATLQYRHYQSDATDTVLILLHGSGWHSMQFYPLAQYLSEQGVATVITPDLRGHGFNPERRGDVDYIGQLEDDLADLIDMLRELYPAADVVVGGHSSGGGLTVRFAGSKYKSTSDAYILLAPFLKYNAPTTRPNSGGWAHPLSRRIAGLTMLNNLGIHAFDDWVVIQFAMPQSVLESELGTSATTAYSQRLNTSFAPRSNYERDLAAMRAPFLLVAGQDDEAFIAEAYEPTIGAQTDAGTYLLLPDLGHIDLLTDEALFEVTSAWLSDLH
jgi:alpha-beta hydrolase superfamily lysophospholipase